MIAHPTQNPTSFFCCTDCISIPARWHFNSPHLFPTAEFSFTYFSGQPMSFWASLSVNVVTCIVLTKVLCYTKSSNLSDRYQYRLAGSHIVTLLVWKHWFTGFKPFSVGKRLQYEQMWLISQSLKWEVAGNIWLEIGIRQSVGRLDCHFVHVYAQTYLFIQSSSKDLEKNVFKRPTAII